LVNLDVIEDVLRSPSSEETKNKDDLRTALNLMQKGIKEFDDFLTKSEEQSGKVKNEIARIREYLETQRASHTHRLAIYDHLKFLGIPLTVLSGAVGGFFTADSLIASSLLGGVGGIVIGGSSISPIAALIAGVLCGAVVVGSIVSVAAYFFKNHNEKGLAYVTALLEMLVNLQCANVCLFGSLEKTHAKVLAMHQQLPQLEVCLTSERYRKQAATICARGRVVAEESVTALMELNEMELFAYKGENKNPVFSLTGNELVWSHLIAYNSKLL